MKKTTKLLSVLLAIVMMMSCFTMAAFAAKANYKTVQNLTDNAAYSPYGTVTRLSTEERLSILCDTLDQILAKANINMGTVLDTMGITITINLTSLDNVCASLDSFKTAKSKALFSIAAAFVNLGIVEDLSFTSWQAGMSRGGTTHQTIINEVFELLSTNTDAVNTVLTSGIQLGMIASFIDGLDLGDINKMVKDLPGLVKSLVFPLLSRADDTSAQRSTYSNTSGNGGMTSVLDSFVQNLFTKPMNWTSYREDAAGNDLGSTVALPTTNSTSRYFVKSGDTITQYDYQYKNDDKNKIGTWQPTVTYTKAQEYEGSDSYVYKAPEGYTGDQTLKYYSAGDKGYFLPSVRDAVSAGNLSYSLNSSNDSVVSMLYKFIPYVFQEMAPTVLNGSVKKLIAGLFDVTFEKIGDKGSAEVAAASTKTGNPDNFFTKDQDFYLWEYSDYKVIDGTPYYRFQDEYFVGTIPENISTYYYMFNWDWHVSDDFVNKYIPAVSGTSTSNSEAGYSTVFQALNDFVGDVIDLVLVDSFTFKGTTYTPKSSIGWVAGNNSNGISNLVRAARTIFNMAPTEIFDEYYNDPDFSPYYNMMMNGTQKQAVTGLLCAVIEMVMPQTILPKEDKLCATVGTDSANDVPFIALGAIVVRELCSQLMPGYNFDALIYSDYNTKTVLHGSSYNADYWIDTVLNMGVDLGLYYLSQLADVGEDDATNGYYGAMSNLGASPAATHDTMTYAAGDTYVGSSSTPAWQYKVDWVIDWALTSSKEWAWGFEKLINCGSTVSLSTYEDPWVKLNTVFLSLLPLDELLNDSGATSTSGTFLENILRDKLVGSICDLDLTNLVSAVIVPDGVFRNGNILTQVFTVVRELLNNILYKVAGNYTMLSASTFTTIDTVLNHSNIKTLVTTLLQKLYTAVSSNGLLVPLMPIVNMFLGWKTDAQEYSEPNYYFSSSSGDSYLATASTTTLKFTNTASGMLLKHRNSTTIDQPYNIVVSGVTFDNGVTTSTTFPVTIAPGATADIEISPNSANDVTTRATLHYSYTGKDGTALGSELTKVAYIYVTSVTDQEGEKEATVDTGDYAARMEYQKYVFTKDIYGAVIDYQGGIAYKSAAVQIGNKSKNFVSCGVIDTAFNSLANTYFGTITDRATAGWAPTIYKERAGSPQSTTGYLYSIKSGVTADTFSKENSVANNLYGVYDMGQVATKYGKKSGTWAVDFIYYNDFGISRVMDKYVGYNIKSSDVSAAGQTLFTTYEDALRVVIKWAEYPKRTDYVTTVQNHIEAAITALDDAYTALKPYIQATTNAIDSVSNKLASLETDPSRDIDFQDHALFEYFEYEKQRTAARAMIKAYQTPAEPESYIENCNLSEAVINAISTAVGGKQKVGIDATIIAPSTESMTNWNIACAEWTAPTYSELQIDDQAAKLQYYYDFMAANARTGSSIYKTFLNKEIAAANAQNYVQANYSTDSWTAYSKALTTATTVSNDASALQSRIFDAKYELMKAQNELIPADASMKEDGYLGTELTDLIAQAEGIIAYYGQYFNTAEGVTEADAFAQLVKALGVRYDVTVAGVDYEGILYGRSAYTYTDYDRLNTNKEKAKVDVAADNLKAALDNFVCTIIVEKNDATTVVEQAVKTISNVAPLSLTNTNAVLARVKASDAAATLTVTPSALGLGTGTKVEATINGLPITTYYVVIYGDINGDGAIDGFDVAKADLAIYGKTSLTDVQAIAAEADKNGEFNVNDIAAIQSATAGFTTISQA